jgi:hypothetical protein
MLRRDRDVVPDMQHRDRDDEGEEEPVRHVDVRLAALDERAEEDDQVGDPDDRQPDVGTYHSGSAYSLPG